MPKKPRQKITDKTPMPWGKFKGTPIEDVPAEYLLWLFKQEWIKEWPDVHDYLVENQHVLLQEEAEEQDSNRSSRGFDSLDDYMRYGR